MKIQNKTLLILLLLIIVVGGIYFVYRNSFKEKKEAVFCPTTSASPHCYLYRCNTGYIYTNFNKISPGNNPLECSDGSEIESIKEVSK